MNILCTMLNSFYHSEYEDSYSNSWQRVALITTDDLSDIPFISACDSDEYNLISNALAVIGTEENFALLCNATNGEISNETFYLLIDTQSVEDVISILLSERYEIKSHNEALENELREATALVMESFKNESDDSLCETIYDIACSFVGDFECHVNWKATYERLTKISNSHEETRKRFVRMAIERAQQAQGRFPMSIPDTHFVLNAKNFNSYQDGDDYISIFDDNDSSNTHNYYLSLKLIDIPKKGCVTLLNAAE